MLRTITAKQFIELENYARLEPFNELRADYRAATIAQMVFNMAVAVKDRKPVGNFLLNYGDVEEPKKNTNHEQIFRAICAAYAAPAVDL